MVGKGGSCRWAVAGGQGPQLPSTHNGEKSPETGSSAWAVAFSPLLNPAILCLFVPKMVTQKAPKNHPKFFRSSIWLRHKNETSTGPDRGRLPRLSGGGPPLKCALSPCQPAGTVPHHLSPASFVFHIHIFLTQTIQSFNTWRLQSKPFVHTRSGNTLNNRPVS